MEIVSAIHIGRPHLRQTGPTLRIELKLASAPDDEARFRSVRDWLTKLSTEPTRTMDDHDAAVRA
jgi:hypothetical protein